MGEWEKKRHLHAKPEKKCNEVFFSKKLKENEPRLLIRFYEKKKVLIHQLMRKISIYLNVEKEIVKKFNFIFSSIFEPFTNWVGIRSQLSNISCNRESAPTLS